MEVELTAEHTHTFIYIAVRHMHVATHIPHTHTHRMICMDTFRHPHSHTVSIGTHINPYMRICTHTLLALHILLILNTFDCALYTLFNIPVWKRLMKMQWLKKGFLHLPSSSAPSTRSSSSCLLVRIVLG